MTLAIKRAELNELRPAAAMQAHAWREAYQGLVGPSLFDDLDSGINGVAAHWADLIGLGQDLWIGVDEGKVVGVCHAGPARDDEPPTTVELTMLYRLEPYAGTGLAARLLESALDNGAAYLWVLRGNVRAIAFYERHGFVQDGVEREQPEMAGAVEVRMVRQPRAPR